MVKVSTLSGTTTPASYYASNSSYNNGDGNKTTYKSPTGVAVDSNGNVFAFDKNAQVIRKILPNGFTSAFCGNGTFTSPSFAIGYLDGNGANALFADITALAIDKFDNLFVLDNNRLRKVTPNADVTTIVANQTSFKNAQGLCIDELTGNIFVSDTDNKRIQKVTPAGVVTTIATGFTSPKEIEVDLLGNLYVADVTAVKKVSTAGTVSIYSGGFTDAFGLALKGNTVYVSDSFEHQIKQIVSGVVSPYAGNGRVRFRDGDATLTTFGASFYTPKGLAIDSNGNLYNADCNNQRIRKITP